MTDFNTVKTRRKIIGKLDYNCDLLEELTKICNDKSITLGRVEAIGAVRKARIGFYDQKEHVYEPLVIDHPMEITALVGNISLKERKPMVHAHVTLADEKGNVCGGHLIPGTVVFACEFYIEAFYGPALERVSDQQTGLPLWDM